MTTTRPPCTFCGAAAPTTGLGNVNAAHWTGTEYVRVDACRACESKLARAPRAPRKPRQAVEVRFDAGGLAALAGFGSKRNATQVGRRRS